MESEMKWSRSQGCECERVATKTRLQTLLWHPGRQSLPCPCSQQRNKLWPARRDVVKSHGAAGGRKWCMQERARARGRGGRPPPAREPTMGGSRGEGGW